MKWITMLVLVLCSVGCVSLVPKHTNNPIMAQEVEKTRYLKVALISQRPEPNPELITLVKESFDKFERKTGIGIGDITYYQVDLSGCHTARQVMRRLLKWHGDRDTREFDIGLVYAPEIRWGDAWVIPFWLVGLLTPPTLGYADPSSGRFAVFRVRSSSVIQHEVAHLFCAKDFRGREENLKEVLETKWRKYDDRSFGLCGCE